MTVPMHVLVSVCWLPVNCGIYPARYHQILGWIPQFTGSQHTLTSTCMKIKMNKPAQKKKNNQTTTQQNTNLKPYITVLQGLSESVKKKCNSYGVQVYFRGGTTIKNLLIAPEDKDPMLKKSRVIYSYKCGRVECAEEYIGESSRTFGERFKEHQKAPSPILTTLTSLAPA